MLLTVFIAATLAWAALALHLSLRQTAHVLRHRDAVPADFARTISPEEHRKAADYTVERERLARVETLLGTGLTIVWSLGGIGLLYGAVSAVVAPGLLRGTAFLAATAAVGAVVDLPLAIVRKFGVEKRFGFNRTTPRLFVLDLARRLALTAAIGLPLILVGLWAMRSFTGLGGSGPGSRCWP